MPEAAAAPLAESLLVEAAVPAAVDVGLGAAEMSSLAGGLGGLSSVGGLFGGAGAGLGATGLGGIQSLAALPATAAEIAPEAMGQIASALNAASPTISSASQLASAGSTPFQILPPELQASQNVISEAAANSGPLSQQASGTLTQGPGGTPNLEYPTGIPAVPPSQFGGIGDLLQNAYGSAKKWVEDNPKTAAASAAGLGYMAGKNSSAPGVPTIPGYSGPLSKFQYDPSRFSANTLAQPAPYQPVYQNYRGYAEGGMADGGISDLGGYSDGGRMLKGPGDGMSDSIPATIANKQPARLANDEFVVPADVVSHLGNGSSDAGAKQLYSMMDRVRKARTGTKKQGRQISPSKYMPA